MTTLTAYVSRLFDVAEEDLFTKTRLQHVVGARQVCLYMMHEYTGVSYKRAAAYFGYIGKSTHCNAIHAGRTVTAHYQREKLFREKVDRVINAFQDHLIEMPLVGVTAGCEAEMYEEQYVSALQ